MPTTMIWLFRDLSFTERGELEHIKENDAFPWADEPFESDQ